MHSDSLIFAKYDFAYESIKQFHVDFFFYCNNLYSFIDC